MLHFETESVPAMVDVISGGMNRGAPYRWTAHIFPLEKESL